MTTYFSESLHEEILKKREAELLATIRELREALEFFAKLDNYSAPFKDGDFEKGIKPKFDWQNTNVQKEGFWKAKQALEKTKDIK